MDHICCVRVEDVPVPEAADSEKGKCGECGAAVWVAQTSRQLQIFKDIPLICNQCVADLPSDSIIEVLPVPGAIEEARKEMLRKHFRRTRN